MPKGRGFTAHSVRREQAPSRPIESPRNALKGEGVYLLPPEAVLDSLTPENRAMVDEYIRELALEQEAAAKSSAYGFGGTAAGNE